MPVIESSFKPGALLRNGHIQTILPYLYPRRNRVPFERERKELNDGDFLDLDWLRTGRSRLAIITHGLEGSSESAYVHNTSATLRDAGWDVLAWNFRGCSGEPNRLLRYYHSGDSADLRLVINHAAGSYQEIALVGFSMGGNMTMKYLGEAPPHPSVKAAVGISVPVDLAACSKALDTRWDNVVYTRRFLKSLKAKIIGKARQFPGRLDITGIEKIRTFLEFDDRYSAPIHGFIDSADYYGWANSLQFLDRIKIPTLILSAQNDPFLTPGSFPFGIAEQSEFLFLEAPKSGGHVGFFQGPAKVKSWYEQRAVEFLSAMPSCIVPSPSLCHWRGNLDRA